MKHFSRILACMCFVALAETTFANQTTTLSPVLPAASLPFRITIEQADFQLPQGVHSGVFGVYKGKWLLIAGTHAGLHGFSTDPFVAAEQNTTVYVVDPQTGVVQTRSLLDPSSGLTTQQIDTLSAISPQAYQENDTLYVSGGYGIDTLTGTFGTKPVLTALYIPGVMQWVTDPTNKSNSVIANIRQLYNPIFQITGGKMLKLGAFTQLVFGQNFTGVYNPGSTGEYSQQVRQFQLGDAGGQLYINAYDTKPFNPTPIYQRRDLNVVPALINNNNLLQHALVAFAGVFTDDGGVWTVPVVIRDKGDPVMADPNSPSSFKQAMNQYVCATTALYSRKYESMYTLFFGGLSYGYFSGGVFQTDVEIPFINQVTTVQMDKNNSFTQYLMDSEYPVILSTGANPGNQLLFGTGAYFIESNILKYPNLVINLDSIRRPTVIGYIVGGIQSTLPNTNTQLDSSSSPHIFRVTLVPK